MHVFDEASHISNFIPCMTPLAHQTETIKSHIDVISSKRDIRCACVARIAQKDNDSDLSSNLRHCITCLPFCLSFELNDLPIFGIVPLSYFFVLVLSLSKSLQATVANPLCVTFVTQMDCGRPPVGLRTGTKALPSSAQRAGGRPHDICQKRYMLTAPVNVSRNSN